ncbi:phage baseplate plug protein [Natroniella sp. ANB-PHB2]|uniref:phage baseplate plug family protein n=1 Tax=Natroniella sp. ANB-PHB2 TaxID=3384444 RepID=UPI0038D38A52
MQLDYLPIDKSELKKQPERFAVELAGDNYVFVVRWNEVGEFFAFDMYDDEGDPLLFGRRITYGVDMLADVLEYVDIVPVAKSEGADVERNGITFDNFMNQVKPYIFERDNND